MALKVLDIQSLISEGKIVDPLQIDPTNAYISLGYWQKGNRKGKGDGSNTYPQYVIKMSDLLGSGIGPQGPIGVTGATGATGPQGPQGPAGPIGPAGLEWQGLWSGSGVYNPDDAVGYNGASWFALNPVGPSNLPADQDPTNWALLAAQGAPGPQGPTGATGPTGPQGPQGLQGPAGAGFLALTVENGLRNLGAISAPIIRLGGNPLIEDTEIPSSNYNLSLSGVGKMGIGLLIPSGPTTAAKMQVRGNGGATGITGIATGTTLTVTNGILPGVPPIVGTIKVGDSIFISNNNGIIYGTYVTAQTGPTTYSLSQAVTGTITATGSPALPNTGNGLTFQTSPLIFKLERAGGTGVPSLEIWENVAIKSGRLVLSPDGAIMSFGYQNNSNPFFLGDTGSSFSTNRLSAATDLSLGDGTSLPGNIRFNRSGFSTIGGTNVSTFDLNYISAAGKFRHRFMGGVAVSRFSENFSFPSVFGGSDASAAINNGAREGYSLSVYQPYNGTTSQTFQGYISGTKLYIYGCGGLVAGILQVGQSVSGMSGSLAGVLEGTTIGGITTVFVPGPVPPPGDPCVTTTVGEYDLLVNGAPVAQTVGSISSRVAITISLYPAWNNTRAMYVDGTMKFKNLPQGAGTAPVYLTTGDIWHDTVDNTIKIVP